MTLRRAAAPCKYLRPDRTLEAHAATHSSYRIDDEADAHRELLLLSLPGRRATDDCFGFNVSDQIVADEA